MLVGGSGVATICVPICFLTSFSSLDFRAFSGSNSVAEQANVIGFSNCMYEGRECLIRGLYKRSRAHLHTFVGCNGVVRHVIDFVDEAPCLSSFPFLTSGLECAIVTQRQAGFPR